MEGKYVIVDLVICNFMRGMDGKVQVFDTKEDALLVCGIYELEDVWVVQLIENHVEVF